MTSQKHPIQIERDEHNPSLYAKNVNMVGSTTIYAVTNTVISIATADIEIGAVELKDGTSDTRAVVDDINALKTSVASSATIYAVVNTVAAGQASVVIDEGVSQIGSVTVSNIVLVNATGQGDVPITLDSEAVVLAAGVDQIGSVTVSNADSIGLATVDVRNTVTVDATTSGDVPVTLDSEAVVLTTGVAQIGSVTVSNANSIGLATVDIRNELSALATVTQSGTVTVDATGSGDVPITLDGEAVVLTSGVAQIGSVTVSNANAIGLATVDVRNTVAVNATGQGDVPITLDGEVVTTTHSITGIAHGVKTVTTAGTDEALAGSTACKKVTIQAQTDNTGWIAVGTSGVDATVATGTGVLLGAGDAFELEIDNLADVYIDSTVDGEGVRYTYFT